MASSCTAVSSTCLIETAVSCGRHWDGDLNNVCEHKNGLCVIADAWGTVALLFCLGAGAAYQQPPMRNAPQKEQEPLMTKGSMV